MTVSAKMILDSSANGERLATIECRYPKFIHGEVMTHRVFSRNASSSRAIPVERLIQDILDDIAMPEKWFKNKPGMQGTEEIVGAERDELIEEWTEACHRAVWTARKMVKMNAHKQHVNRVIEPFCHITTLITSTQWSNFMALRMHPDADPTINALAREIYIALRDSEPIPLEPGHWHLPYVDADDRDDANRMSIHKGNEAAHTAHYWELLTKLSVARAARVSYKTQEGKKPTIEKDLELYDRLIGSIPLHASPAEHQATPSQVLTDIKDRPIMCGAKLKFIGPNLGGNLGPAWKQYRKTLAGECQ